MSTQDFLKISFLTTVLFFTLGCDKYQAKKLAGTYSCEVEYDYWDMTPTSVDSTYNEDLEIKREGKNLVVLDHSIDIDELRSEEEYYYGYVHNYIKVTFDKKNNTVRITRASGGIGGNATRKYFGIKK